MNPNIELNFEPNIEPNIEPNKEPNNEPDMKLNIDPNMEPILNQILNQISNTTKFLTEREQFFYIPQIYTQLLYFEKFFLTQIVITANFFWINFDSYKYFLATFLCPKFFGPKIDLVPKFFWIHN